MALLDVFRKKGEDERFKQKQKEKVVSDNKVKEGKKSSDEKVEEEKKQPTVDAKASFGGVIIDVHTTEKSTISSENNAYIFKVKPDSNKFMISKAVREVYGVTPRKVNVIRIPAKRKFVRGKAGVKAGYKKAVVYLNKKDKIELA